MSNKTEQPTPKRLRDARKKGDVPFSRDANNVVTYLAGVALIFLSAGGIGDAFAEFYREVVAVAAENPTDPGVWSAATTRALGLAAWLLVPVIAPLAFVGLLLSYAQVGVICSTDSMKPRLSKLNPLNQLKNWFSVRGLFELGKTFLKLAVVILMGYLSIKGSLALLLRLGLFPRHALLSEGAFAAKHFLLAVGLVLMGLGALDLAFHRWQWKKRLMMTKEEVKRELKEQEGHPEIKSERRSIHQEILQQDVVLAVSRADVVVINPTHFAVAIAYKKRKMAAPKVMAKGQAQLARKIVRLAEKMSVPLVRDVSLARALYELETDAYIPRELYEAVAEVLLFAWRFRREAGDSYSPA